MPDDLLNGAAGKTPDPANTPDPAKTPDPANAPDPAKTPDPVKTPDPKKDDKPAGAPEKYEAFKLPEGLKVDDAQAAAFQSLAKELNLTQDAAQKLVDFQAEAVKKAAAANEAAWDALTSNWAKEARADKEYGGADFDKNLALANAAVKEFGGEKLVEAMKVAGFSNNPELIRAFWKVGKAVGEDKLVGGAPKDTPKDPLKQMYPSANG